MAGSRQARGLLLLGLCWLLLGSLGSGGAIQPGRLRSGQNGSNRLERQAFLSREILGLRGFCWAASFLSVLISDLLERIDQWPRVRLVRNVVPLLAGAVMLTTKPAPISKAA